MSIPERLSLFIKEKYKTAKALSKAIGVSENGLSQILKGKNQPSAKVLIPLLQTGISIDWLLTGEGSMLRGEEQNAKKINQGNNNNIQLAQGNSNTQSNGSSAELQIQVDKLTKELKLAQEKIITLQEKLIDTLEKK